MRMWIDLELLSKQQKRKIEYILKDIKMPKIKVKVLNEDCMPERTHRWDAGWDLKSTEVVTIPASKTAKVQSGVIFEIPTRHCCMVVPRSSVGAKYRITLANDIGIIDSEYRGEIMVYLSNDSEEDFIIDQGVRFAQLLVVPVNPSELWPVDQLSETGRGEGGLGSTTEERTVALTEGKNMGGNGIINQQKSTTSPKNGPPSLKVDLTEIYTGGIDTPKVDIAKEEINVDSSKKPLKDIPASEYLKLKGSGELNKLYPEATGNIREDLCL